jgi:hypothetical protein
MTVSHTAVLARIKEIRNKYYEAMRRQDLEGFFREIAVQQLTSEAVSIAQTEVREPIKLRNVA